MNFQDKTVETVADFGAGVRIAATRAVRLARAQAAQVTRGFDRLQPSLQALQSAGLELNQVARRHLSRFVKENVVIAQEAGSDVAALARSTYARLKSPAPRDDRKSQTTRKRARVRARRSRGAVA